MSAQTPPQPHYDTSANGMDMPGVAAGRETPNTSVAFFWALDTSSNVIICATSASVRHSSTPRSKHSIALSMLPLEKNIRDVLRVRKFRRYVVRRSTEEILIIACMLDSRIDRLTEMTKKMTQVNKPKIFRRRILDNRKSVLQLTSATRNCPYSRK